jgi:hypothetical protein
VHFIDKSANTKYCSDYCRSEWKKKSDRDYGKKNRKKIKLYHAEWRKKNREHHRKVARRWRAANKDKVALSHKHTYNKLRTNINYRLNQRMSKMIYDELRDLKNRRTWKEFVPYTVDGLKQHLESLFTNGMSWNELIKGNIHIDHKIPRCTFKYNSRLHPSKDLEFQKCWALENLQPLWKYDNIRKGRKLYYEVKNGTTG